MNDENEKFEEMMPSDSGENHQETKEEKKPNKISIGNILGGMVKGLGTGVTRAVGFISPVFYKVAHPKISKIGKQVINRYSEELEEGLIEDFAEKHGITNKKAEYILSIARQLITEGKQTEEKKENSNKENDMTKEQAENIISMISQIGKEAIIKYSEELDEEEIEKFVNANENLTKEKAKIFLSIAGLIRKDEELEEDVIYRYSGQLSKEEIENFAEKNKTTNKEARYFLSIEKVMDDIDKLEGVVIGTFDEKNGTKMTEEEYMIFIAELITEIVSSKSIDVRPTINPYYETRVSLDGFCSLIEKSKIKEKTLEEKVDLLKSVRDIAVLQTHDTVETIFDVFDSIYWDKEKIEMIRELKGCTAESIKKVYKVLMSEDIRWDKDIVKQIIGISGEKGSYDSKYILKQLKMHQYNSENTLNDLKNPLNIKGKLKFLWTIAKLALTGLGVFTCYEIITNQPQEPSAYSAHLEVENDDLVEDGKVAIEKDKVIGEPAKVDKNNAEVYFSGEKVVIIDGNEAIYTTIKKLRELGIEVAPDEVEGHIHTEGEFSGAKKIRVRDLEGNEIGELPVGTEVVVDTAEKISGIAEDYEYIRITTEDIADSEGEKQRWSGCVVEYAVKADGEPVALEGKNNCVIELKENTSYRISADCSSDENILKKKGLNKITVASLIAGPDGIPYFKTAEGLYVPFSEIKSVKDFSGKKLDPDKLLKAIEEDLEKQQNPETINVSTLSGNDRNRAFRKEKEVDDKPKAVRATVEMVSDAVVPEVPKLVEDAVQRN